MAHKVMCSICNTEIKVNRSEAFLRSTCTCVAGIASDIAEEALTDGCFLLMFYFKSDVFWRFCELLCWTIALTRAIFILKLP